MSDRETHRAAVEAGYVPCPEYVETYRDHTKPKRMPVTGKEVLGWVAISLVLMAAAVCAVWLLP